MPEKPIAKCQAIKASYRQTCKGLFITFMLKETLPLEEFADGLIKLPIGEVCNLYATIDEE